MNNMSIEQKNLDKLSRLLQAMDSDSLTRSDFTEAFKKVTAFVNKIEQDNLKGINLASTSLKEASESLNKKTQEDFKSLKDSISKLSDNSLLKLNKSFKDKVDELNIKMSEVKNGKDADEKTIVEMVKEQIKIPTIEELKDQLPVMGEEVRDSLELLKDEERLDVSAIKGLKKLIKKLTPAQAMGGGTNLQFQYFIDDETPTGTVNGTNKAFTVSKIPNPATSLKVFVNGQKMTITEDYTYSSQTITFVTAPPTGSIITIDYRV